MEADQQPATVTPNMNKDNWLAGGASVPNNFNFAGPIWAVYLHRREIGKDFSVTKGRKPKPTHLKLIQGNPGRRPPNKNEPTVPTGMPSAPSHLSHEAKLEWRRVAPKLFGLGVLTQLDRSVLAGHCQAYARWTRAEKALEKMAAAEADGVVPGTFALLVKTTTGVLKPNPLVGTANAAMQLVMATAAEMGLSPSARTRVETTKQPSNEPFDF